MINPKLNIYIALASWNLLAACSSPPPRSFGDDDVILSVSGQDLRVSDLPFEKQQAVYKIEKTREEALRNVMKEAAFEIHLSNLAREQNKTVEVVKDTVVARQSVSNEELESYYSERKATLGSSFHLVKDELRSFLIKKKTEDAKHQAVEASLTANDVRIYLDRPMPPAIQIDTTPFAKLSTKHKKFLGIEISKTKEVIEVLNYACPHCRETEPQLKSLLDSAPHPINLIAVDRLPDDEPDTLALAKGAYCAKRHNAYEDYRAAAFSSFGTVIEVEETIPKLLKIDIATWQACLQSPEASGYLAQAKEAIKLLGSPGTPTFFVDGHRVEGIEGLRVALK